MKNRTREGSLFGLLTRNYLLFTLTLLLIAGGVFYLWDIRIDALYQPAQWDKLLSDPALLRGQYDALNRYLYSDVAAFAVYDANGRLLYATADDFDAVCTPGELSLVRNYAARTEVSTYETSGKEGVPHYLLIENHYRMDGTAESTGLMALDADYRVVFGGFDDGRDRYTRREYLYLTGERFPEATMWSRTFADGEGQKRTILLREGMLSDADYYYSYARSRWIWLLFVPLYLIDAGLFIWWLSRKIGRPLRKLNDAVVSQSEGHLVRVGDCGGTREIRRIGESFDRFSERLAESEEERRRLDEGRQKLIADISHDLKTPITVIAGYVDAICDGKVPPGEMERYLKAIQAKAETLTELVNAFHEYSKVEHPEFVLHMERTDLCEFLREYLARKYDEIDLAGFTLEVEIPEHSVFCAIDPLQFRRVIDNLLSNALRHNRLGTILYVDLTVCDGWVTLCVGDNGAGIPPERAKYIFEPFVVGSDARSGKGSGLGLAITRRIMEKHGGSIALSEHPSDGRSTEFILRLPLQGKHAIKTI